jgi:hypothetical protein
MEQWTLERLGVFCLATSRRWATDGYRLGKALLIAKTKMPKGQWMNWVKEHCPGVAHRTINRLMAVAKRAAPEELEGLRLNDAYKKTGVTKQRKAVREDRVTKPAVVQSTHQRLEECLETLLAMKNSLHSFLSTQPKAKRVEA